MDAQNYISLLKEPRKTTEVTLVRYAMFDFLFNNKVSADIIAKIFGCSKRNIYYGIKNIRGYLQFKDLYATEAYKELYTHKVTIRSKTVRHDNGFVGVDGFELVIDNITF